MLSIGTLGCWQNHRQADSFIYLAPEKNDGLFFLGGVFIENATPLIALKT